MTAAHCICSNGEVDLNGDKLGIECKTKIIEGKWTSHPDYDFSTMITILVGVNNMNITEAMEIQDMVYHPAEVEQVPD